MKTPACSFCVTCTYACIHIHTCLRLFPNPIYCDVLWNDESLNLLINSLPFTEYAGSLPCSYDTATGPYPMPDEPSFYPYMKPLKIHPAMNYSVQKNYVWNTDKRKECIKTRDKKPLKHKWHVWMTRQMVALEWQMDLYEDTSYVSCKRMATTTRYTLKLIPWYEWKLSRSAECANAASVLHESNKYLVPVWMTVWKVSCCSRSSQMSSSPSFNVRSFWAQTCLNSSACLSSSSSLRLKVMLVSRSTEAL